jgi:hypothetical protein
MTVYQVRLVTDTYKALDVDSSKYDSDESYDAAFRTLRFEGKSKDRWKAPQMHCRNPLKADPDFWQLITSGDAFAVGAKALKAAYSFFEAAGEILPLPVRDKKLEICNITRVYDCIDQDRSTWNTLPGYSKRGPLVTPVFVPAHFQESTLFKIPERPHQIFCWEEDGDTETEFKACVEKHKLKGLKFIPVWDAEKRASRLKR